MFRKILFHFTLFALLQDFALADELLLEYRCANENLSGESASRTYASPSKIEIFSSGNVKIHHSDSVAYPAKKLGSSPSNDLVFRGNQPDRIHTFFVNKAQPSRGMLVTSLKTVDNGKVLLQTCQIAELESMVYDPTQNLVYRCKEKGSLTGRKYPDLAKITLNDQSRTAQLESGTRLSPRGTLPSKIVTPLFWYKSGSKSYFFKRPNLGTDEIANGSQIFQTAIWTIHKTKNEKITLEDLLICSLDKRP